MKTFNKHLSLLLALLMLLIPLCGALASCSTPNTGDGTETTSGDGSNPDDPNTPIDYKVIVKSAGGRYLPDITVKVHTEENGYIVTDPIVTDESGTAVFSLKRSDDYYVALGTVPDGYTYAERYEFIGSVCEITLSSFVIDEKVEYTTGMYKLGSVVHDFTFEDVDGNEYVLSKILKEKDCVLLNFWYVNCNFCRDEFPLLDEAYLSYFDDVEVLALNNYGDTVSEIKEFRDKSNLALPMVYDTTSLMYAFITQAQIDGNQVGYPISVVIDRYGVVSMIEIGAILDDSGFSTIFKHFTEDDYKQILITSPEDLIPKPIPDIDMPASNVIADAFNQGDITVEFTPETSSALAEMSWPFIVSEKDGKPCIVPSNSKKNYSYATMHAKITLNAGDVVAFDYFASTEANADYFSASVDGIEIRPITGLSTQWETYYAYVADAAGTYDLTFRYVKDSTTHVGDDTVYLRDLRIVTVDDIDSATYIPRQCATNPTAAKDDYQTYTEIFFNEADGYYHVGSEDGPLLLANLLGYSLFKNGVMTAFEYAQAGDIILNGKDYTEMLTTYANYASNSKLEYCCTVDQGLMECLKAVATLKGTTENPDTEWLQFCKYYAAYKTEHLPDPIQGLSFHSAFEAQLGADNKVEYDGRIMIPRGYLHRFTPEVSGAYRITSNSTSPVEAWVFMDTMDAPYYEFEPLERLYADPINCSMVLYMEAGVDYYIDIAYYDYYEA
ncbi:MAG: TlpA family protein disulfide reductase, partial [Clostridia bacterium]|nr:TlpA family protein disulfide reductase [Clostridia bacterium]